MLDGHVSELIHFGFQTSSKSGNAVSMVDLKDRGYFCCYDVMTRRDEEEPVHMHTCQMRRSRVAYDVSDLKKPVVRLHH